MKLQASMVALLFVGGGVWWFLHHNKRPGSHSHQVQSPSSYICPMHPQVTSDRQGACPICGMDLVAMEKSEEIAYRDEKNQTQGHLTHEEKGGAGVSSPPVTTRPPVRTDTPQGHASFKLSLRRQQMIGVKLGRVQKKKLFKSIRAPGRMAFDPELYTVQSEYLEALKQWKRVKNSPVSGVRENTRQMISSSKIRLKVLGLSDSQIKDLAKKGFQSEGLLVSGEGQNNWIYADVFEVDLPYIEKGLLAQVTANFLQGRTLQGKVISVDQVINPTTRTAKVRIQLVKQDISIRPESYVNITILAPVGEHLSVPLEALMDTGRETFVFVKKNKNSFEPLKVNVILETNEEVALTGDLVPGDEIVVGGNFMLDSESRLRSVIQSHTSSMDNN